MVKTDRGGDITYHGPGQIVGYPILNLSYFKEDLHWYLRSLEETIILTLADYGIKAQRLPGATGVWIDPDSPRLARKICAIGVRMSRWVTMHGFAFNVNTNLHHFAYIIPCGIADKGVTSLEIELGKRTPLQEVKQRILQNFSKVFNCQLIQSSLQQAINTCCHEIP